MGKKGKKIQLEATLDEPIPNAEENATPENELAKPKKRKRKSASEDISNGQEETNNSRVDESVIDSKEPASELKKSKKRKNKEASDDVSNNQEDAPVVEEEAAMPSGDLKKSKKRKNKAAVDDISNKQEEATDSQVAEQEDSALPQSDSKKSKKRKRKALPEDVTNDQEEPTNSPVAVTENLKKEISKNTIRSKKRAKHVEIQKTIKDKFVEKRRDDIDQYLNAWKQDRTEWKFQKVKQIFIEKQLYNTVEITDDLWPITLEYLAGSREATKEALLKDAQKIIGQFDDSEENADAAKTVDEKKYKRARDIMQTLQC